MKVAYINPTFLTRRPLVELANHFGGDVLVPKKPFKKYHNPWHDKLKGKVYTYSAINIPFLQFEWPIPITPAFFYYMHKLFKENDVVHMWTFFYPANFYAMFLKLFYKTKLIFSCDTMPALSFKSGIVDIAFKAYYRLFGWTFIIPDVIHTYSELMVPFVKKTAPRRIVVIPTGVNVAKFSKGQSYKIYSKLTLVFAGIVGKRKGVDRLIEIMKQVPNCRLEIYGKGPEYKKLIKETEDMENVIMCGWSHDLPQALKNTDALLFPSRGEGLPGIVMEAMASGLPIIASDIPCIPDLVEHEENGFLCDSDFGFVQAIKYLDDNPIARVYMGKKSLEKIQKFDWKILFKKYRRMYNEIAKNK